MQPLRRPRGRRKGHGRSQGRTRGGRRAGGGFACVPGSARTVALLPRFSPRGPGMDYVRALARKPSRWSFVTTAAALALLVPSGANADSLVGGQTLLQSRPSGDAFLPMPVTNNSYV